MYMLPSSYRIERGNIYNTAAATRIAAKAATTDAEPRAALLLTAITDVDDAAVDEVGAGMLPATTDVPFAPVSPVGAAPDPAVVPEPEPPMPTPWDGERPPPEEAMLVAEAAEEREEAPLEWEEAALVTEEAYPEAAEDSELAVTEEALLWEDEPDPETDPEDAVELDATAEVEEDPDEAEDEELEETAEQERSNNGVVLKVEPTIPKLGEGTVGSASWRVNHQVLTLPRRGHATSSQ